MDELTFNRSTRVLNKAYFEIFGVIPCKQDYSCSREEYIEALKIATDTKTELKKLLPLMGKTLEKDALT